MGTNTQVNIYDIRWFYKCSFFFIKFGQVPFTYQYYPIYERGFAFFHGANAGCWLWSWRDCSLYGKGIVSDGSECGLYGKGIVSDGSEC